MIEDWYRHHQTEDLSQFLCADHVLKGKDASKSWLLPGVTGTYRAERGGLMRVWGAPLLPQGFASLPRLPGREMDRQEGRLGELGGEAEQEKEWEEEEENCEGAERGHREPP